MHYLILAAGRGSRLRELTEDSPKTLVQLQGHGILEYILKTINKFPSQGGIIVTGYKKEKLQPLIAKYNLQEVVNPIFSSTNMVYSLALTLEKLKELRNNNPACQILMSYSDTVFHPNVIEKLLSSQEDITIAADSNWQSYWTKRFGDPLADAETFKLSPDGHLTEIGKKPTHLSQIEGQYTGLLLFQRSGLSTLIDYLEKYINQEITFENKTYQNAYFTDLLQHLITTGVKIKPTFFSDPWIEVDSEEDLVNQETRNRIEVISSTINL